MCGSQAVNVQKPRTLALKGSFYGELTTSTVGGMGTLSRDDSMLSGISAIATALFLESSL